MERIWIKHRLAISVAGVVATTLSLSVLRLGAQVHPSDSFWVASLFSVAVAAAADRAMRRSRMCTSERMAECRAASRTLAGLVEAVALSRRAAGQRDEPLSIGYGVRGGEPVVTVSGKPFLHLPSRFQGFPVVRVGR